MVLVAFHPGFQITVPQMTLHTELLQLEQLNSREILIYFIFKTIKCDRSSWPERWKVDRSTPKSVRTLSVDRPLFWALTVTIYTTTEISDTKTQVCAFTIYTTTNIWATPTSGCNFTIYIMTNICITNTRVCLCHLQNDWHWWQKHQHQVVSTFTIYTVQGSKLTFSFGSQLATNWKIFVTSS